jgi:Dolichyl-phosphate-mannose-protein mannosyltransferase
MSRFPGTSRHARVLIGTLIVVAGLVFRIAEGLRTYLNPDELQYVNLAVRTTFGGLFYGSLETHHPALLFFLLHPILLFTTSELALRIIPILSGSLFPVILAWWLSRRGHPNAGLVALFLLTLSPILVSLSAQVRAYTLCLLFAAMALWILDEAIDRASAGLLVLFGGCLLLAIMTEYMAACFVAASCVYAVFRMITMKASRGFVAVWVLTQLGALATYVGLYVTVIRPILANPATDAARNSYLSHLLPSTQVGLVRFFTLGTLDQFGYALSVPHPLDVLAAAVAMAGIALCWRSSQTDRAIAALAISAFAVAAIGALARVQSYGASRHSVFLALFAVTMFAIGLEPLVRRWPRWMLSSALVIAITWPMLGSADEGNIERSRSNRSDLVAAIQQLRASVPSGGWVFTKSETAVILAFYTCGISCTYGGSDTVKTQTSRALNIAWIDLSYDPTTLHKSLADFRSYLGMPPNKPIWIVDGGWHADLSDNLKRLYPGIPLGDVRSVNNTLIWFESPPGI